MKLSIQKVKAFIQTNQFRKILKRIAYGGLVFIGLILLLSLGLRIYFNQNKTEIVAKINKTINDNILGHASIGDVDYKFLMSFPNITILLDKVELRNRSYAIHNRSMIKADEIEVRLNTFSLLSQKINIEKIELINTKIDLFKNENGISNFDIFKPKIKENQPKSNAETRIHEVHLKNVIFISENLQRNKLFHFEVAKLKSKIDYTGQDWEALLYINTLAKSMAFNTLKGSFIKDKKVKGQFAIQFSKDKNRIDVLTNGLEIGKDNFDINASFGLKSDHPMMNINIKTRILWSNATQLLNSHLFKILNPFNLSKPIKVNCSIKGDLNAVGDPEIIVVAQIKNNELTIPDGKISNCNFTGKYTNNFKKGLGYNDPNSAIVLTRFSGFYKEIPFGIPSAMIHNLEKPVASGSLQSHFDVIKMKNILGDNFIQFYKGKANVDLKFNVDIVDLRIHKPHFTGKIDIKNAELLYKPKNLNFKTNAQLDFTDQALFIRNIKYQSDRSIAYLNGKIENFLNLYYDDPEKMVAVLTIKSPFLDANKFLSVLTYKDKKTSIKNERNKQNKTKTIAIIEKCQVVLNLSIDEMVYSHLTAKNAKIDILANNGQFFVKQGWIETCGGNIKFESQLIPKKELYNVSSKVKISSVDIPQFLKSFKNFGIQSFDPNAIKGNLSATLNFSTQITAKGHLIEDSMKGNLKYDIKNGALINFQPMVDIGKFAFTNRDVNHIVFNDLSGKLNLNGSKVNVKYCKVSSNVLNFDVVGVYSFKKGTQLGLIIPLRDPKKDIAIKNKREREAKRLNGIVLHLLIVDGKDGKMKIKLGSYNKE